MSNLNYIFPFFIVENLQRSVAFLPNYTRHPWARWDAFISTADPDVLFGEYHSRGLAFRKPILDDNDGLRGFELADADGYVLFFGRPEQIISR